MTPLPRHTARRYVQPLREGGSLPAIVDTDDGLFVVKFRGAGQGARALVAEIIVARIAEAIGLQTPALALIDLPSEFGRSEPDPEIQDLLRASHGTNVGMRFLDGAFNYDPRAAGEYVTADFAARVVWLDAFTTNVDRTHRNPNLLIWNREPWLIDHGAALYAHHNWETVDDARTRTPFQMIEKHVLLAHASSITAADESVCDVVGSDLFVDILAQIPDDLFAEDAAAAAELRKRYVAYLLMRSQDPRAFVETAENARQHALNSEPQRVQARR